MKTIHFIFQGKGGVGKTLTSSYLMQYIQERNTKEKIMGVDTDPNNSSFTSIKALKVKFLSLLDENEQINERNFDALIELLFKNKETTFVIDNGATSFLPLIGYLVDNNIFKVLEEHFKILIHIPVTGGQAQKDTLNGMEYLIKTFHGENINFIIWVNEFFGKLIEEDKTFEELNQYEEHKKHIKGIMYLPEMNAKTYGKDLEDMTKAKLTFQEVLTDPKFSFMTKQRLTVYKNKIFESLDLLGLAS